MPKAICSITRVASRLGISARKIRAYESEGFITIERISGRCYLLPEDIETILVGERLKSDLGVNMASLGVIFEMRDRILDLRKQLARLEQEFEGRGAKTGVNTTRNWNDL